MVILTHILAFLVMLNPFALFLYLSPVREGLDRKAFAWVLVKASMISFVIYLFFLLTGNWLFEHVFRIHFEAFRIFGGIVIFSLAYLFIINGRQAMINFKEDLDDLANEIALPFMVGAGTISLTLVMAYEVPLTQGVLAITIVLFAVFAIIMGLELFREMLPKEKLKVGFDKNMEIYLRLTGFFLGAIGVDMIVTGIKHLFFV